MHPLFKRFLVWRLTLTYSSWSLEDIMNEYKDLFVKALNHVCEEDQEQVFMLTEDDL